MSCTPELIAWLRIILEERLGLSITISQEQGSYLIGVVGSERTLEIDLNPIFYKANLAEIPFSSWDCRQEGWETVMELPLPAPGVCELPRPLVIATDTGCRIQYDLLGLTYWMLARIEEIGSSEFDLHGRFSATSSHAFKHDYLERPIIDEWLLLLGQVVRKIWPGVELKSHQFSVQVSHDVDRPSRYAFGSLGSMLRAMAIDVVKHREIGKALRGPWIRRGSRVRLHSDDPLNTFDWIMSVSERNDLRSAFYFICGRTDPRLDANYEIEDKPIRQLIRDIYSRGHEIGLHPSYDSFLSKDIIREEAERLRRVLAEEGYHEGLQGGRMHYLRWRHPVTLRAWDSAGLKYDSTLGYADRPGFRCGTCFEYPAFDAEENRRLSLRIRPLIAMECTVIASPYLGLGVGSAALEKFLQLKNTCRRVSGHFTLLWHNSQLDDQALRRLYEDVIAN